MALRALAHSGIWLLCISLPARAQDSNTGAFDIECSRGDFDLSTGYEVCRGMSITSADGRIAITTGQASSEEGFRFEGHIWKLVDGVRLMFDDAEISADSAVLVFEANELVSADIQGSPVELTDFIEERNTDFHASADRLVYDSKNDTLHIPGQATFRMGEQNSTGCDLLYNPVRRRLTVGDLDENCGASIRFIPEARDTTPDAPPDDP